ncbi:IQ domain-containing protein K isoform X4 [Protopterus annectens]|uniref:IQ domain-containing protein K isoform X4 n=1 Tax=Protopterus annectens TaxID=7888 RepID=UPI001CF9A6D3|nr:IQ domain-containing protein K isoform X4 [Protopterus annectens]
MAKVIVQRRPKTLWEEVCEEFEASCPSCPEEAASDKASIATIMTQYSPSKHSPVFCGHMVAKIPVDTAVFQDFEPEKSHPAFAGYAVVEKPAPVPRTVQLPDPKTCSPREYLEHFIFPVLLPGMSEMIHQAKKEKCFERKQTIFNACDYLTEWLYNKNPKRKEQPPKDLFEIPFVKDWLKDQCDVILRCKNSVSGKNNLEKKAKILIRRCKISGSNRNPEVIQMNRYRMEEMMKIPRYLKEETCSL